MSTITTAPGLLTIDPIQGLVDYVSDIKPFHTKIFEVLFEYIYTDNVNTTVVDTLVMTIDDNQTYFTSSVDPAIPNPQSSVTANSFWFDPTTSTLYIRHFDNLSWDVYQTGLSANPNPTTSVDTAVTEFVETISFNWGGNYDYPIVSMDLGNNQVSIAGNLSNAIIVGDITEIDTIISSVTAIAYDPTNNVTIVTMAIVPNMIIVGDVLTVQDIDITYWYEFAITGANPTPTLPSQSSPIQNQGNPADLASPQSLSNDLVEQAQIQPIYKSDGFINWATSTHVPVRENLVGGHLPVFVNTSPAFSAVPSITVSGNATTAVQVGTLFKVNGSGVNDGVYYAVYVQYEPIANTTTIGVAATTGVPAPTLTATGGGFVIPYRFINEVPQGSYDTAGYDTQPFDQSAGSIIYQGP